MAGTWKFGAQEKGKPNAVCRAKKKKKTPKPHTQKGKTAVGVGGGGGAGLQMETKALGCYSVAINLATFYKSPEI